MKVLILKCFVSLFAASCLNAAAGPQAALHEPGRMSHDTPASPMSGGARAEVPAPGTLVWVQLVEDHNRTPQRAAEAKKPASVGAVWITTLILAIYVSVPVGIVLLLLPHGSRADDDEPKNMPPRKKMRKPDDGGDHPLPAWMWLRPRHT
ncbi:hypothetical protein [Prosthecobacter sp.]|jgi:hypothetical protein|uniref:hypothetical protein n=1 Tax=Prosthecobacter sp. TaxID=1965333 RepID=UPI0037C7F703